MGLRWANRQESPATGEGILRLENGLYLKHKQAPCACRGPSIEKQLICAAAAISALPCAELTCAGIECSWSDV